MKDEIKEILDYLKDDKWDYYPSDGIPYKVFLMEERDKLLDYITNLQQENKEWGMIFDTFSSRPYAHRYLEEKRKELGNKRIMGLDSEMIYKEYYDLKEIEQDHKETNATLMSELAKLEEENERLKEENNNKAMNDYAHAIDESWYRELYDDYKSRCEKAIEYIENTDDFDIEIFDESSGGCLGTDLSKGAKNLLNILQNGSDSNE